jgi:phosphohistidine phosphatase
MFEEPKLGREGWIDEGGELAHRGTFPSARRRGPSNRVPTTRPYASRVRLFIVRHAKAADGEPDESRPLNEKGRKQARKLGKQFVADGIRPDAILTSPLLRAHETAAEIGSAVGVVPETDGRLAPGADADAVRAAAAGRGEVVVVVGHQPDCGQIAAELSGGPEPAFPAAGVFAVDV